MSEYDVAVVGAGIAGMSAALTAARLGRRTILLGGGVPGGQLLSIEHIDGVPGFPEGVPGYDFCPMSQEMCEAAGAEISTDSCASLSAQGEGWRLETDSGPISARAVVIASGSKLAKLGVPGEAEFEGRGVSECASCDGPLLRGKVAVVAGGGDSAMQEALALIDHVGKVVMVVKGTALTGQSDYVARIEGSDKVEIRFGTEIVEILGDASGVTGVRLRDSVNGAEEEIETAAVFIFTGLIPNVDFLAGLLPLDGKGQIIVDAGLRTAAKGLCAAGNVRQAAAFRAAGAMGDGAVAARSIEDYLTSGEWA